MTGSRHIAHSKANRKNYRIQSWNRKLISGVVELALDRKWAGNDHFRWSQVKVWPRIAVTGLLFQSSPKLPSCRKTRLKSKTETDRKWGRNSKKFHIECLAMYLSYLPAKFQADPMCVGCAKSKRVTKEVGAGTISRPRASRLRANRTPGDCFMKRLKFHSTTKW